jgi:hypothetical protein
MPLRPVLAGATAAAALAFAGAAAAQPERASEEARSAAMAELVRPGGVGGCVFLALKPDVRRQAMIAQLSGQTPFTDAFKAAVGEVSPRCTSRPYAPQDAALVGAVTATLQKGTAALALAQQNGLGQTRLDGAWRAATAAEKAAFYAIADEFLDPAAQITRRTVDVAPFARALGLPGALDPRTEILFRMYFISTALSERAEALLASQGAKPQAAAPAR